MPRPYEGWLAATETNDERRRLLLGGALLRPLPAIGSRERRGRRREEPPQPGRILFFSSACEAGPGLALAFTSPR